MPDRRLIRRTYGEDERREGGEDNVATDGDSDEDGENGWVMMTMDMLVMMRW